MEGKDISNGSAACEMNSASALISIFQKAMDACIK